MTKRAPSRQTSLLGIENETHHLFPFFLISLAFHTVFFLMLAFMPELRIPRRYNPSVINVSMVSLGEAIPAAEPAPPGPVQPEIKAPEPPPVKKTPPKKKEMVAPKPPKPPKPIPPKVVEKPAPPDAISVAPKKKKKYKPKTSLKKKTYQSNKVVKSAVNRLQKKVEKSRPSPVDEAIAKMRTRVAQTEATRRAQAAGSRGRGSAGRGAAAGRGALGPRAITLIDIYRAEVPYHIGQNWAFSEMLAGLSTHLETVIVIKILASGEITDIKFEKKSGNKYLDDSAYRAVQKSSPLPPLPKGYPRSSYTLGLVFGPSGLRR